MVSNETRTIITIFLSVRITTGILGLIANFLQLVFICRDKKQRNSVFGMILLSLCVADIFVSFFLSYSGITNLLNLFLVIDLELSNKLIRTSFDIALIFSILSSFSHVVFIAVVRVLSLVFPFRIKQIITKLRCKIILVVLWFFSIGLAIISHLIKVFILSYLAITTSCLLLLAYSIICYRMCKRRGIQGNESTQRNRQKTDKHVLLYSMILTFIFCSCILPFSLSSLIKYRISLVRDYIILALLFINPLLDPLLYFFVSHCRQRRANVVLPNRNCQHQTAAREKIGKSQNIQETRL